MDSDPTPSEGPGAEFLLGGGEMGARMRATDWSETPLGPAGAWPQSLRAALSICIGSGFPIAIYWGPELVLLYNDAWSPIPGTKHPWALGRPAREVWSEIWSIISPLFEQVLTTGQATRSEDQLLPMYRHGYTEECYFDYTFSPVRGEGGEVAGVFNAVVETTYRVLAERRTRLLSRLADTLSSARSAEEVCELTAATLAGAPEDVPFCLLYLLDADGPARLAGAAGPGASGAAAPEAIDPRDGSAAWPLFEAASSRRPVAVADLSARFGVAFSGAPWPEPATSALIVPIANTARPGELSGFLVGGISPRRALDEEYRSFVEGIAARVGIAIATARAYEEERKRAEQLAEIDRAKTTFFSNVSHEFRTPLTLMLGPLDDLLSRRDGLPAEERELLAVMRRNGQRLLKLVNTLLDFSRIEAGRVQAVYEPTDLAAYTADLASVFRSAVERAGMRLAVDCPPLPEPVYVDRDMWEKIVLNLVSNAFKYTHEGEIEVSLRADGGSAVLSVRDTGIGIAEADLPDLFNRFHRIEGARGRTQEGTGIGLALVQELARLHGGAASVESVEGRGSTFRVAVPFGAAHLAGDRVARDPSPVPAAGAAAYVEEALRWLPGAGPDDDPSFPAGGSPASLAPRRAGGPKPRIVLADDNADMRDYAGRLLAAEYDVVAVADGREALRAALDAPTDLVLTDVMMPGLDGFELLGALRADPRTAVTPVVMLSARAGEEARVEGLEAGADDYMVKPFSARELLARVGACLAMARLRQEAARRERALRERAEEASRAKDEFLATVSHELRTPLNSMLGWTRLLRSGRLDPATAARALETIERNTLSQAQLIEDLLDVSRIITGKLRLKVETVDLAPVVQAAADSVRLAADSKGIALRVVADPAAGPVSGDPERLQQVVWNLLSNAVKFTPKGGTVRLELARADSNAEIVVSDNGRGIGAEFLPYVFERFRQADGGITREHGGLGLGLSIVRHLVELHGGTVGAESGGEGEGATFVVRLPLVAVRAQAAGPRAAGPRAASDGARLAPPHTLAGVRVLVVDDEADTRELLAVALGQYDAVVRSAGSVAEALAALDEWEADVVVSDIGMPDEDGYELIRRLRARPAARGGAVPAVALTAYARFEDRMRALRAGFQMHVAKPVEPAELAMVVHSMLRFRR